MDFGFNPIAEDRSVAFLAVTSVVCAIWVALWPYVARDPVKVRMRHLAEERERIRIRERMRLEAGKNGPALRREPSKLFLNIIRPFKLMERASGSKAARMLRMAGYRSEATLIAYFAIRVLAPIVMFAATLFYVLFLLRLPEPMMLKILVSVGMGVLGFFLPAIYIKNRIIKRQQAMMRAWPDALDLMLICVESGMSIEGAFHKVSEEIGTSSVELAEEIGLTTAELSYLQDRRQAYENLAERTGLDAVKAVVASLKQAEKHGTSIGRSLRVLAQESRDARLSMAEKKAAALPPKLTVPMILFFLPVLFAVIITPTIIQVMETH